MDRRDFLKKTGGAAATTVIPGLDKAGQIATQITKAATQGFILNPEFLAKYIQKVADIPITVTYDWADEPDDDEESQPQADFTLDCNAIMKFMGINPDWKKHPQGHRTDENTLDPQDVLNKVYQSTGDKNLIDQMQQSYTAQLATEKRPGNAIYNVLWKYLGANVTPNIAKQALGQLINQKGYSNLQIGHHAKELGQHSIEILKGIIKHEGGPQNIFKTDIRELKKTWTELPDRIKKGMKWNNIEDLEEYYQNKTLTDIANFPNAAKILNLPDWLIKSVQKNYSPHNAEHKINQDVKDYMKDYLKTDRTQADKNLTQKHKPNTQTLGHWNKEAKNLKTLKPGQNLGFYTSESIHCNTHSYKNLINEIIDPNNTDLADIQIKENGQDTNYTFHDPRHNADYTVEFTPSKFISSQPLPYTPPNPQKVSILLIIDDYNRFAKSGKGNFAYVYSRLTTCIIDYFHNKGHNPEFVTFSGYTTDMDSVYNKIIERLTKKYPNEAYHPYAPNIYISQTAINDIKDDQTKMEVLNAIQNQTKQLNNDITAYKDTKRKTHKTKQNQRWHYDSSTNNDEEEINLDGIGGW